ncbi:MAG TPA: hypothetical protein VGO62_08645, partial [Myxococcota bacterium]
EKAELERRAHEAEARTQQLEAQIIVLRSELQGAHVDVRALVGPLESELQRLRDENARLLVRSSSAADAEVRVLQLTEDVARARAQANHAPEVERLTEELLSAQKTTGRLYTDLDVEKQTVARLHEELRQRTEAIPKNGAAVSDNLLSLVSAVGPMLWGLEQAIKYLEPFGAGEATLQSHVKQLQLLEKVLQRIAAESH